MFERWTTTSAPASRAPIRGSVVGTVVDDHDVDAADTVDPLGNARDHPADRVLLVEARNGNQQRQALIAVGWLHGIHGLEGPSAPDLRAER